MPSEHWGLTDVKVVAPSPPPGAGPLGSVPEAPPPGAGPFWSIPEAPPPGAGLFWSIPEAPPSGWPPAPVTQRPSAQCPLVAPSGCAVSSNTRASGSQGAGPTSCTHRLPELSPVVPCHAASWERTVVRRTPGAPGLHHSRWAPGPCVQPRGHGAELWSPTFAFSFVCVQQPPGGACVACGLMGCSPCVSVIPRDFLSRWVELSAG